MKILISTVEGLEDIALKELKELVKLKELKLSIKSKLIMEVKYINDYYKICYLSRSINQSNILITKFNFKTSDDIFNKVKDLDIELKETFKVSCIRFGNHDFNSQFIAAKSANILREKYNKNPDLKTPQTIIQIDIINSTCLISLDLIKERLSKRFYKIKTSLHDINSTIAFALVSLSKYEVKKSLLTLYSGNSTIAIEAALFANNIPINQLNNSIIPDNIKQHKKDNKKLTIYSVDDKSFNIHNSQVNAKVANVEDKIKFFTSLNIKDKFDIIIANIPVPSKRIPEIKIAEEYNYLFREIKKLSKKTTIILFLTSKTSLITKKAKEYKFKLEAIKKLGINPYPYSYDKTHNSIEVLEENKKLKVEERSKKIVKIAGRIMTFRLMGKACFGHIQDQSGKIQFYIREDENEEDYKLVKLLDLGDIIGIEGIVFRTKTNEITVRIKKLTLLSKSLRPLPEKWHGLKDPELRYRQRYVDLIVNPDVKETFIKRTRIIEAIKEFMNSKGYLEVKTPVLQPIYGGANARPFTSHLNALNTMVYLRISDELYLKRLIVGGYERVYEISEDFRNEGIDRTHNPELTMIDSIKKYANIDVNKLSDEDLQDELKSNKIAFEEDSSRGILIQHLFEELVESHLIQPVFIIDHPKETTPLCKEKRGNPALIERFEPFINGWEMGNAYSELNNALIQRKLLEEQASQLKKGNEEANPMDEDFVRSLEIGMPPTGGLGLGIDRMVMLFTNSQSIRDVIFFPFMRPEND